MTHNSEGKWPKASVSRLTLQLLYGNRNLLQVEAETAAKNLRFETRCVASHSLTWGSSAGRWPLSPLESKVGKRDSCRKHLPCSRLQRAGADGHSGVDAGRRPRVPGQQRVLGRRRVRRLRRQLPEDAPGKAPVLLAQVSGNSPSYESPALRLRQKPFSTSTFPPPTHPSATPSTSFSRRCGSCCRVKHARQSISLVPRKAAKQLHGFSLLDAPCSTDG